LEQAGKHGVLVNASGVPLWRMAVYRRFRFLFPKGTLAFGNFCA
jgi:hypothetical protein